MGKYLILFWFLYPGFIFSQVTYYDDVAPIINKHCKSCHKKGDIGPMPLTNYEEVASYASMIKFVIAAKLMPPFKANYSKVAYKNERSVTSEEKEMISKWIASGLTKGEPKDYKNYNTENILTDYDYSVCMDESFEHYGIYYDQYQAFVLPLQLQKDRIVEQVLFVPGNKEIVRSAGISISPIGSSDQMDKWDPRYGYFAYGNLGFNARLPLWYTWMPHTPSLMLNQGESLYLPKDSELSMHLHYGPFGEVQKDSSCIHIKFSNDDNLHATLQNVPLVMPSLIQDTFVIQPGIKKRISSSFYIPSISYLKSITPVSHLLCRSWEVFAVLPDKSSISLLSIEDWDFHWREKYIFKDPIVLPAGSKIVSTALFDNTLENLFNPADPPIKMKAGMHMFDENFTCYFEFKSEENTSAYFEKPFSVTSSHNDALKIHVDIDGHYNISLYNLTNKVETNLLSRNYKKGQHTLKSAFIPKDTGRYAFILSREDMIDDVWYFVVP